MELVTLWMGIGFLFAAYSVIANDSVQTLGTWIASNNERVNWKVNMRHLFYYGHYGMVGICTVVTYRMVDLTKYHSKRYNGIMPSHLTLLLLLTRIGVPVSTSFLVLSAFASTFVLEKMLMKSMMGYAVAAVPLHMHCGWVSLRYWMKINL